MLSTTYATIDIDVAIDIDINKESGITTIVTDRVLSTTHPILLPTYIGVIHFYWTSNTNHAIHI